LLNQENEKLLHRLEQTEQDSKNKHTSSTNKNLEQELSEASKRLKKRELECQALWDTLKDLKNSD